MAKISQPELAAALYWWHNLSVAHQFKLIEILKLKKDRVGNATNEEIVRAYRQCPNKSITLGVK